MKRWEYFAPVVRIIRRGDEPLILLFDPHENIVTGSLTEHTLDDLGRLGWELIALPAATFPFAIFKREVRG